MTEMDLAVLRSTGYLDGGPNARQEELYERLLAEEDKLRRLRDEADVAEEFLNEAKFLSLDLMESLREHYSEKVEIWERNTERTRSALKNS